MFLFCYFRVCTEGKSFKNHPKKDDSEAVDLNFVRIINSLLQCLFRGHVARGPSMIDYVNLIFSIVIFKVHRDTPVSKFKLDGQFATFGSELIASVKINQYI